MAALLYRLGSFAARKAWTVIVSWVVILGLGVGAFLTLGGTPVSYTHLTLPTNREV